MLLLYIFVQISPKTVLHLNERNFLILIWLTILACFWLKHPILLVFLISLGKHVSHGRLSIRTCVKDIVRLSNRFLLLFRHLLILLILADHSLQCQIKSFKFIIFLRVLSSVMCSIDSTQTAVLWRFTPQVPLWLSEIGNPSHVKIRHYCHISSFGLFGVASLLRMILLFLCLAFRFSVSLILVRTWRRLLLAILENLWLNIGNLIWIELTRSIKHVISNRVCHFKVVGLGLGDSFCGPSRPWIQLLLLVHLITAHLSWIFFLLWGLKAVRAIFEKLIPILVLLFLTPFRILSGKFWFSNYFVGLYVQIRVFVILSFVKENLLWRWILLFVLKPSLIIGFFAV